MKSSQMMGVVLHEQDINIYASLAKGCGMDAVVSGCAIQGTLHNK